MKNPPQQILLALILTAALMGQHAMAAQVEFDSPDYSDGDLTNNVAWNGEGGNTVTTAGTGYGGANGTLTLAPASDFIECIVTNSVDVAVEGDTIKLSARLQYTTTGVPPSGAGNGGIFSLQWFDDSAITTNFIRVGLRRVLTDTDRLLFFLGGNPGTSGGNVNSSSTIETNAGVSVFGGTSDWLEMTASLTKGASSNDWSISVALSNLTTSTLLIDHTFLNFGPTAGMQDDPTIYGGINSTRMNSLNETSDRIVDNFCVLADFISPPPPVAATILSGSLGNADFQDGAGVTGAQTYSNTVHWFNAQGTVLDEDFNFTQSSQMAGSTDPAHTGGEETRRGGMPFQNRTQVNDTGYTITNAGQVFSLSYDFGAGGNPANWNGGGDETMRTFLFTANAPVDGALTNGNMTELGGDEYDIDLANDGQWTTRNVPMFYTASPVDVGKTVYFGMQMLNDSGPDLFPRIDVIDLTVSQAPAIVSIVEGATGNGNFNTGIPTGPPTTNTLLYSETANWHWASGDDATQVFVRNDVMGGSTDPNSGGGYVFQNRLVVNDAGYTIAEAGQVFSLFYEFGAGGNETNAYGNDEFLRAYLFTANAPVDGSLTNGNISQLSDNDDYFMNRNGGEQWTTHYQPNLYTASSGDIGKTVYLAVQFNNPVPEAGFPNPRLENVLLAVTVPDLCSAPALSIALNGANVDVSWFGESGCDYQLQTNGTINGVWGEYGSSVAGGDSNNVVSIPISGGQLYIRADVQ